MSHAETFGYRPVATLRFPSVGIANANAVVDVQPTGQVICISSNTAQICLNGIAFWRTET